MGLEAKHKVQAFITLRRSSFALSDWFDCAISFAQPNKHKNTRRANVNGLKAGEGITFSEQTQRRTNLPTRCGSAVSTTQLFEGGFFCGLFIYWTEQLFFLLERSLSGSSLRAHTASHWAPAHTSGKVGFVVQTSQSDFFYSFERNWYKIFGDAVQKAQKMTVKGTSYFYWSRLDIRRSALNTSSQRWNK